MLIEIGIAIEIEIEIGAIGETVDNALDPDPDPDLDWARSCCTAKTWRIFTEADPSSISSHRLNPGAQRRPRSSPRATGVRVAARR